jgi:hypothetical protein
MHPADAYYGMLCIGWLSTVGQISDEQLRTAEKQCLRNSDGSLCSWRSPALASRLLDTADPLVTGANLISQFLPSSPNRTLHFFP